MPKHHPSIEFFAEGDEARSSFASWLRDLAGSLEQGMIDLEQDGRELKLHIPEELEYEFKVEHDPKGRVVIHIHVHYHDEQRRPEGKSLLPKLGKR